MEDFQAIQFAYPQVPDWTRVPTATLCQLVEHYADEPNCATSALTELAHRGHSAVGAYCRSILVSADADSWLRASALSHLMATDAPAALEVMARDALSCSPYLYVEMVSLLAWDLPPGLTPDAREAVSAVQARQRGGDLTSRAVPDPDAWGELNRAWEVLSERFPARES